MQIGKEKAPAALPPSNETGTRESFSENNSIVLQQFNAVNTSSPVFTHVSEVK